MTRAVSLPATCEDGPPIRIRNMSGRWQLLDRPSEREAIRSALTGDALGIVIMGGAGVGKTTLARTVTDSLPAEVHWAGCTESSRGIPLGAFAPWVSSTDARDPVALLAAAREALFSHGGATIIGVDDAHLLDRLSATLLHHIAMERVGRIVATVRSGEPVPAAVTSLWKDGYLSCIELEPLSKSESIGLVETVLGGTLEELSADVLWEASGGNPLYLRYSVEGALAAGTLTATGDVWQLRGPTVLSAGLVGLLETRLDNAGDDAVDALRALALCEPLDIDTLCEVVGERAVDAAELEGLLRIVSMGAAQPYARIVHPLYADVIRRRTGTATARRLRGRIAASLREHGASSPANRVRLAQLYADSDQPLDTGLLVTAAKDAMFLANLPLGERLARKAFENGGGLRAAELLSRAVLWQGRPGEAEQILRQFDPAGLDELELVRWGLPRLSTLFWMLGEIDGAYEILTLLHERLTHPALLLLVDSHEAAMAVHESRLDRGLAIAERVLAAPHAPTQAVDFAAFAAGLAMGPAGRGGDFEPIAARCRDDHKSTDGMIRVMIRYGDVLSCVLAGRLDVAERRAAEYAEYSSTGQFIGWAIGKITQGVVYTYRGDFPAAISTFEQALAALNAESSLAWQLPARLLLARAYAAIGRPEQADRVLADAKEHSGPQMALHEPARTIAESWAVAARGGERTAADLARRAADQARRAGQFALEAEALHHAARFGSRSVAGRLAELPARVDGVVVTLQAEHAAAVATADAAALDAVSRRFEETGFLLSAADAAAQAARWFERGWQRRQGAEAASRAKRLAAACGGATTPAIRAAVHPLPVSGREREVATLIGEGLSNREIAERLTVSVRTVEGHVYRACLKLNAADRDELAAIVRAGL